VVWALWLAGVIAGERWEALRDNAIVALTMAFGSFVTGMSSECGGATVFPILTLGLDIPPPTARDFLLMIRAVGMTSAAVTILATGVRVERRALVWTSLGGAVGVALGLEVVADRFSADFAKMFFASVWLAFAFALWLINKNRAREVRPAIAGFGPGHARILFATGVLGGVISSVAGNGIDFATFALLALAFRVSESVATPTSVVLMGVNAAVGFGWKELAGGGAAPAAWGYWWACVPVVVVAAPLGARFVAGRSRSFVTRVLYTAIAVQFAAALWIVPWTPELLAFSAAAFVAGLALFGWMARRGGEGLE
jgi:uncharacterized membrane protein YfcA